MLRTHLMPDFCMMDRMKTTLDLRDDLLVRAKARAANERTTLTQLIEEGLALRLRPTRRQFRGALPPLPVSRRQGGVRQGIDDTSNRSMFDAADE